MVQSQHTFFNSHGLSNQCRIRIIWLSYAWQTITFIGSSKTFQTQHHGSLKAELSHIRSVWKFKSYSITILKCNTNKNTYKELLPLNVILQLKLLSTISSGTIPKTVEFFQPIANKCTKLLLSIQHQVSSTPN